MKIDWGRLRRRAVRRIVSDRTPPRRTHPRRGSVPPPACRARTASDWERRNQRLVYAPHPDGNADPGEVVWIWVPYEEGDGRGKDRPVLIVGRDGATLLGLMLSSNPERSGRRHWSALGAGAWDGQHRASWIRLDRVLAVPLNGIRREGAVLAPDRFQQVAAVLRAEYGWA